MGFSVVFLVFATGTWDLNCEVWGERDVTAKYARNPALQGHIRLDEELHLARVAVRKPALVRMLREHVAVFDFEGFADAIHEDEIF
jgi:hypothetical protein